MTTKGMLIWNFALNIYWRLSKQNTTQRLLIRNFALVSIGDLISIPFTKSYLSTKGCTPSWSLNATYKILSVHQRMYSELSLKQELFPKKTTFSFKNHHRSTKRDNTRVKRIVLYIFPSYPIIHSLLLSLLHLPMSHIFLPKLALTYP